MRIKLKRGSAVGAEVDCLWWVNADNGEPVRDEKQHILYYTCPVCGRSLVKYNEHGAYCSACKGNVPVVVPGGLCWDNSVITPEFEKRVFDMLKSEAGWKRLDELDGDLEEQWSGKKKATDDEIKRLGGADQAFLHGWIDADHYVTDSGERILGSNTEATKKDKSGRPLDTEKIYRCLDEAANSVHNLLRFSPFSDDRGNGQLKEIMVCLETIHDELRKSEGKMHGY